MPETICGRSAEPGTALFLLGPAGSGKTELARAWIAHNRQRGQAWALLDKDDCETLFAPALLQALGEPVEDRDSPAYLEHVREPAYKTCLLLAARQLEQGLNVVLPAPWSRELSQGRLSDARALGLPAGTRVRSAFLHVSVEVQRARIAQRKAPRDAWKLEHWDAFAARNAQAHQTARRQGVPVLSGEEPLPRLVASLDTLLAKED